MIKVEAPTLEEAYKDASLTLECSISELQCEVVQHPNNGILGLFKKMQLLLLVKKLKHLKESIFVYQTWKNALQRELLML